MTADWRLAVCAAWRTPLLEIDPERPFFENSVSETKSLRSQNSPTTAFPDRSLGGEFRVTFRVHERSHNEVQQLETPMRTALLPPSEKMANLQAAVYDRR